MENEPSAKAVKINQVQLRATPGTGLASLPLCFVSQSSHSAYPNLGTQRNKLLMRQSQDHTVEGDEGLELSLDVFGKHHLPRQKSHCFEQCFISNHFNLALKFLNAVNRHLPGKSRLSYLHVPKGEKEVPHLGKELFSKGKTGTRSVLTCTPHTPTPHIAHKRVFNIQGQITNPNTGFSDNKSSAYLRVSQPFQLFINSNNLIY